MTYRARITLVTTIAVAAALYGAVRISRNAQRSAAAAGARHQRADDKRGKGDTG